MKEKSMQFPSVAAICQFLRDVNRHHFVLLGKKAILIAPFSAEEIAVATKKYGANLTETVEAELLEEVEKATAL